MKIVLSWLRELCSTDLAIEELAGLLTSRGAKVEDVLRPWERLSGVVAARVIEVRDHPNSDKLCLARVSTGSAEREVVVGVRNMRAGDLVPLAGPGAMVLTLADPLEAKSIRGVVSEGMICSPMELGVAPSHDGILILPTDVVPGDDVKTALGLDGAVFDIEVTPNRPDLLSVIGVARELSAATGVSLTIPDAPQLEADEKAEDVATVEIRDLERCPRYVARIVRGVRHVPSPPRVQARLTAAGMRPISAAIDATNYAMLELGQPLHPFDLALLEGPGIVVRRAEEGERLVTLDDVERTFTSDDLMIADAGRSVAVAGIMGGAVAEVSESTKDILLESASFERRGIYRTARRIGLTSEASTRFEHGVDPEAAPRGADRACQLMAEWCRASVLSGAIEAGGPPARHRASVRPSRATMLLGYEVSSGDVAGVFDRLGMTHTEAEDHVVVEVPGYRYDLDREVDLIEEVARVRGYDLVGSTLPAVRQAGGLPPPYEFRGRVRSALVRAGLREVRLASFASEADLRLTGDADAPRVANPLSAEEAYLRTDLVPGLMKALARNLSRQIRGACLFEVGTVFALAEDGVREQQRVAFGLTGSASSGWAGHEREFDFFDAKGVLESLLADLGVRWSLGEAPGRPFHPGRSASVVIEGTQVGVVGEIHPAVAEGLDFPARVSIAELDLDELVVASTVDLTVRDVPRFPPVRRDLAFIVDEGVPAGSMRTAIEEAGGELLDSCLLFDVFSGPPLPPGKKSLAFSVDFRAPDRTLTDEEAQVAVDRIVERLAADFGAELRAG